jgi:putative membrane protein
VTPLAIALRGLCMGAADAVPGVSGGTVALIAGIYPRLLGVIGALRPSLLGVLRRDGIGAVWRALDGNFALALLVGIAFGLFGLSTLVLAGLAAFPALVWAAFLGLVMAAVPVLTRAVTHWSLSCWVWLTLGLGLASGLGWMEISVPQTTLGYVVGGTLALSAMILPGLSGSFVLLLVGLYQPVFSALHAANMSVVVPFAGGALVGLLGMARVLSWLLARHQPQVMACLIGLMVGSCVQLWPFSHAPWSAVNAALALAGLVLGCVAVWGLDRWSKT